MFHVVVLSVTLLIGLSKGGMGAVLAALAIPLLSEVMPISDAISISLPMLIIADVFALRAYWKTWDLRYIKLLMPMSIVGILIGTFLLTSLDDEVLRRLLGIFVLIFVVYKLFDKRITSVQYQHHNWHAHLVGLVAGIGSAVANAGSPPFTIYLLLQNITPIVFVGTTTLYFALINLLKIPPLILTGILDWEVLLNVIWVFPVLPLGVWLGRKIINRINQLVFERLMLVVLAITAVYLLVSP